MITILGTTQHLCLPGAFIPVLGAGSAPEALSPARAGRGLAAGRRPTSVAGHGEQGGSKPGQDLRARLEDLVYCEISLYGSFERSIVI